MNKCNQSLTTTTLPSTNFNILHKEKLQIEKKQMDKNNTGCPEITTRPRKVCQPIQHGKWIQLDKGLNASYLARTVNRLHKFYPHGCVHHTPANKVAYKISSILLILLQI